MNHASGMFFPINDFVFQMGQFIVPVEVKAGKSGSLKSLLQFAHQKQIPTAIRFDLNLPTFQKVRHSIRQASDTVEVFFDLLSLPLYMVEEVEKIYYAYSNCPSSPSGLQDQSYPSSAT